ncbi:MAG: prolyl oligopeptidase family serine peptidase [Bryobacteraceae bacterium]
MPKCILNAILIAVVSACCSRAATPFTIEQVMSAPFASELIPAPTGAKVVWLLNEQGRRNIWEAGAPDWTAHRLTNFMEDDGQEIAEVTWAKDGSFLLFTRGGDLESGRENPNPTWADTRPDQSIWRVDLNGAPPKKMTEGHSAAISPTGQEVAFLRAKQIFLMKPTGDDVVSAATQQGSVNTFRWSPDGSQLAFVSVRREHSFIGIYDSARKTLRYLDPSVDRDIDPVWSPDGSEIAYLRIAASADGVEFVPQREGEPWAIRVCDLASGRAREVFRASDGPGSVFHGDVAEKQIFWSKDGRLVFPWEKTGWLHLYSVPATGGEAVELTPGEGVIEHVALSSDGSTVYYSTNIGDIDRRHIGSVAAQGGKPKQVTSGEGIEWEPAPLADGSGLVTLASSFNQKSHAALWLTNGRAQALAPETVPKEFPSASLVKPQQVIFAGSDGMMIHGQLFLPSAGGPTRHTALLFFHGGSRRQMLLGFHYMYYYSNAYALNQYLASKGYVVMSVNYRSGIGYGLDFREALHYGAAGASEFNDVTGAALYLKSRADVDPAHIGLWGGSYGGYLTALGLARASSLFSAGVDFHGVHDWSGVIENFTPNYDSEQHPDAAKLAFESSPMASVKDWKSPVLLIHGDDDRNVPFSQTVMLVEALRRQHVDFEQLIFPNEIHDFLLTRDWVTAYRATADFFARKLPPEPSDASN